jgi:cytochrome b6-f complex iron-sulfur subunit
MAEQKLVKNEDENVSRREFISWFWLGWITFSVVSGAIASLMGRFLFPNVLFEKPAQFRAGPPSEFAMGVDERFKDTQNVWIVRTSDGVFALSTVCTHLGCTPNWLPSEFKFKCPCHGSGYRVTGLHFEGPAPRPLERFAIGVDETGVIKVDKSKTIRQQMNWGDAEFILKA